MSGTDEHGARVTVIRCGGGCGSELETADPVNRRAVYMCPRCMAAESGSRHREVFTMSEIDENGRTTRDEDARYIKRLESLIEQSSLGTPEAQALRATVSDEKARSLVAEADIIARFGSLSIAAVHRILNTGADVIRERVADGVFE